MSEIPTADLTIPTMESTEEAFDIGKYGFSEEEYPELAGKSEGEVLSFIVQALSQSDSAPEAPTSIPLPEPVKSDGFGAAFDYGSDNMQAMVGAGLKVLGQGTGIETLEEYGQELQDTNEKEAEESLKKYDRIELKDVSPGDNLTTFIIQTLGETLPSLGVAVAGGTIGATAAALTPVAALTGTIGAGLGAYLPSSLIITGEAQITAEGLAKDKSFESPGTMLMAGALGGAIDTLALAIPSAKILGLKVLPSSELTKFFLSKGVSPEVAEGAVKKARKALKDADGDVNDAVQRTVLEGRDALKSIADSKPIKGRGLSRRALAGGRNQALIEGATEGTQQAITTAAAETATGEEVEDYGYNLLDATVRGAIAGVGPGALAGGITGRNKAGAEIAQEKQEKLQEALVLDEANSSPDFDEETSTVVSTEEKTVGDDTFVEIVEKDSEDRVRTQRINLNDIVEIEPTDAEIAARQKANVEVEEEKENSGTPSESSALAGMGIRDRDGNTFAEENALEDDPDAPSNLDQEIIDLKSEVAALKRLRQLRGRASTVSEAVDSPSPLTQEAQDFVVAAEEGAPANITNNLRRIAKENGVEITEDMSPMDVVEAFKSKQVIDVDPDATLQEAKNISELIEQREAKLAQYKKFFDSNNNRLKFPDAYKSLIGENKNLEQALNAEPRLDFNDISGIDSTIAQLENDPIGEASSVEDVSKALELVGESLEPTDDRASIIEKLKAGRESLLRSPSFAEGLDINNPDRLQEVFQAKFPKLMEPVDTTLPQNPKVKAPASPEVQKGIDDLADVASQAEGSRGRRMNWRNIVAKSKLDADNLATKLGMWSRFMASSYQQATKFPKLRPLVQVMEEYNIVWRSIMNSAFMGRTLVYALDAENKARYRAITELKNTVNQDLKISGLDGNKRMVLKLTDPTLGVDPLIQLYGERDPNTGERTGEYKITQDGKVVTLPALFKYKDIYGYTTLSEAEYIATYPKNELVVENDPQASPEQNERTQLLINAMEQEKETIRTLYDKAITAVINRSLSIMEPSIQTQVESTEDSIIEERESNNKDPLTEGQLAVAAMERVAAQERQASKLEGQDNKRNSRNVAQLEQQIEIISRLNEGRRLGYFPRSRNGDVIVRIIRKTFDSEGEPKEDVIHREDHNTSLVHTKDASKEKAIREKYGRDLERRIKNTEGFDPNTDTVEITVRNKENKDLIKASEMDNFFILEAVLLSELDHSKNLTDAEKKRSAEIFKEIAATIRTEREARGFRQHLQHRRNIPGAMTPYNEKSYHNNAWAQYVSTLGRFVARQKTDEAAQNILNYLPAANNIKEQGQKMWDNTKSPQGMASAIKSIAFLGFLAGNISSSALNLTQNFVTASILYGAYGKLLTAKTSKSAAAAGALTTKYLMGRDIGFQPADREGVAAILFKLRAADSMDIARKQFDMLLELQERGIVGKINTEAMSSNSDITSSQMVEKLFGTVPGSLEQRMSDKQYQAVSKAAGVGKRTIDFVYAFSELANRINAALATYNAVEAFGLEGDVNPRTGKASGGLIGFAKGTAFEGQITDVNDAASFVINQSQFNLDAFNRPQIAFAGNGLGAITLQFLPFVTMMIEVYANAIGKYGGSTFNPVKYIMSGRQEGSIDPRNMSPQGKRALVFMMVPQFMLGGLFGLPFVDDLREIYKILAQALNIPDSDVELMFYEAITSVGGPESYQLAEFFGRGAFKTYLGTDVAQRTALSPLRGGIHTLITDEKSIAEFLGGPATSYIRQAVERSSEAFKRGDYGMAMLKLIPVAGLQNVLKAIDASEAGVQTGAGRVIGDGLTTQNLLMMSMGFAPRPVYEDRDRMYRQRYYHYKNAGVRKSYVNRAVRILSQIDRTESAEGKQKLYEELQELYNEVYEHDLKAELVDQIDPNHTLSLNVDRRYMEDKLGRQSGIPATSAKSVEILEEKVPF